MPINWFRAICIDFVVMKENFFYNLPAGSALYKWHQECYNKSIEHLHRYEYSEALYYFMRAAITTTSAYAYIAYCFQYGYGVERNPYAALWFYDCYARPGVKMSGWVLNHYTRLMAEVDELKRCGNMERYHKYRFFDREIGPIEVVCSSRTQNPTVKFTRDGVRVYKSLSIYEESPMELVLKALENRDYYRRRDSLGAIYDGFTRDYPLFSVGVKHDAVADITSVKRGGRHWVLVPYDVDLTLYATREYIIDFIKRLMLKDAKEYLPRRVEAMSQQTGLKCSGVKVVGVRTKLGCFYCRTMQMELSYHLMKSTPEFVDAVIVHELSHIFGKDHDSEFYRGFETHSSAEVVRIDRENIGYSNVYDI